MVARKWKEHFQLGMQPTLEGVNKVLFPKEERAPKRKKHDNECIKKYKAWVKDNGEPEIVEVMPELQSKLDGTKWLRRRRNKNQ
jgi:hypothetical protein